MSDTTPELLHIVCPHCDIKNRVPSVKLTDGARCGGCHQALFQATPLNLDERRFECHLAGNDIPILVDFWAPWCGPCRAMTPAFATATGQLEPLVRLVKINTQEMQGLATRFGIRSIPTMVLFHTGRELARTSGAMDAPSIVAWTQKYLLRR